MRKTIGIIGGMGPLATCDLFEKIVTHTRAGCDQEHLHILIDNNTSIPDRTRALLSHGEDPLPQLIISAGRLQRAGADFLIMPCNTAHCFYEGLQKATELPILHMPAETAKALARQGVRRAGLLATDGTVLSGVYDRKLAEQGIETLKPDAPGQREVMRMIYEVVKAGRFDPQVPEFLAVCRQLLDRGAETLILGCTELPLAFARYRISLPYIDPTLVLAEAAIRFAGAEPL